MSAYRAAARQKSSTKFNMVMLVGIVALFALRWSLVNLGDPAAQGTLNQAAELRLRSLMKDVETGLSNYQVEYGQWPEDPALALSEIMPAKARGPLLMQLLGDNPRSVKFFDDTLAPRGQPGLVMEIPGNRQSAALHDPWGNCLYVVVDAEGGSRVANPEQLADAVPDLQSLERPPEFLPRKILLFSAGPDGYSNTWSDNIRSWR